MQERDQIISISLGTIIKAILAILFFGVLFILKDLILVLLMSIVIASAIEPGAQWFVRRGVPRLFSVIAIYLLIAVCFLGAVFFLLLPLLSESGDFLQNFPTYFNSSTVATTVSGNSFLSSQPFVASLTNNLNIDKVVGEINTIITTITSNTFGTVTTLFGGLLSFVLMVVISFYLAVEEDGVGKFLKAITTIRHEKYVVALWKRSQKKIGLWMQGQLILALIIGTLVYLGLLIINVPNALLLATLAAVFEIIPLFGPILASIPAILISFATGGLSSAIVVACLYIIVHQFENQLIYPLVVKKVVGVSPIISIVALVAGWELAGIFGLILAVPTASVLIEFFDDLELHKIEKIEKLKSNE